MKALFFTYDFPYPTNSGGKTRAYYLLKQLAKKHEVILFSFTRKNVSKEQLEKMKTLGIEKIQTFPRRRVDNPLNLIPLFSSTSSIFNALYYDKKLLQVLFTTAIQEKVNLIHFESFYTGYYLHPIFTEHNIRQVFGTENIEYQLYEDYAHYVAPRMLKPFIQREVKKIRTEEKRFYKYADMSLAVTDYEKEFILENGAPKCEVIENGVDLSYFAYKQKKPQSVKNIVFIGNFSYFPNVDAVRFFYGEVFQKISDKNVTFTVVGKGVNKFPFSHDTRVKTSEYVDDIRDIYYSADCFVSPIRIGGGTNFKILEAMACGVPVISFSDRIKGIGAKKDVEVLTADTQDTFGDAVIKVLSNPEFSSRVSKNARSLIEKRFAWDVIGAKLHKTWESLL